MDVRFPDGTVIRALGLSERKVEDRDRDYGLYFDPAWRPTWPSDVVELKDFGLPGEYESVAEQIRRAFLRAKRGERVEIGCISGLGRTGTALAKLTANWRSVIEDATISSQEREAQRTGQGRLL